MRFHAATLIALAVLATTGCADPLDDPDGVLPAILDADDDCINTSITLRVDDGSDSWMTDDIRPDRWVGDIPGTFSWRGLDGRFVATDGTSLDYVRLGEGQFTAGNCRIG